MSHMIEVIRRSSSLGPINMSEVLLSLTNSIICTAAFGSKYGGSGDGNTRFQGILGESHEIIIGFGIADFFPSLEWINRVTGFEDKLDKVFHALDSFFEDVIEEHLNPGRPKPEHEDFIDVMLRVQKDVSQAISLTRDHIKAVIMDMFLAGTDTTFATLVWAMTELIRNPRVMKKAREEVWRIVGEKKTVEDEDLHQLNYLKLVLKEVLRLHPPVPLLVPRECNEKCNINGYDVPLKTRLFVNVWAIMRDPQFWENPDEFWPERFTDQQFDFTGQNFQYIPFGSGRRRCPGSFFGMATVELALASLLHSFEWELPAGMRKEDVDMSEALGLALHKKVALRLVASPRVWRKT
ncbi:cytochrome P450 71A9-like [Magnolia sinica]|uniref:cytochrome P450 71A9-like n=1 Tax=Magnolia sinica TaxID=86752 RepID=UPI00265A9416|nr:cytochrome P450 71A9-like [Magnolia sinica]